MDYRVDPDEKEISEYYTPVADFDRFYAGLSAPERAIVDANLKRMGPHLLFNFERVVDIDFYREPGLKLAPRTLLGHKVECYGVPYGDAENCYFYRQRVFSRLPGQTMMDPAKMAKGDYTSFPISEIDQQPVRIVIDPPLDPALFTLPSGYKMTGRGWSFDSEKRMFTFMFARLAKPGFSTEDLKALPYIKQADDEEEKEIREEPSREETISLPFGFSVKKTADVKAP